MKDATATRYILYSTNGEDWILKFKSSLLPVMHRYVFEVNKLARDPYSPKSFNIGPKFILVVIPRISGGCFSHESFHNIESWEVGKWMAAKMKSQKIIKRSFCDTATYCLMKLFIQYYVPCSCTAKILNIWKVEKALKGIDLDSLLYHSSLSLELVKFFFSK